MFRSFRPLALVLTAALCLIASPLCAGDGSAPEARYQIAPTYPEAEFLSGAEGAVLARVHIGKNGAVQQVEIVDSEFESAAFGEAVVDAVSQWRYRPAREAGKRVSSSKLVRMRFSAPDPGLPRGQNFLVNSNGDSDPLQGSNSTDWRDYLDRLGYSDYDLFRDPGAGWALVRRSAVDNGRHVRYHNHHRAGTAYQPSLDRGVPGRTVVYSTWARYQAGLKPSAGRGVTRLPATRGAGSR